MPQDQQSISYALANAKLSALRERENILLDEQQQKADEELFRKLQIAIEHSLFLEKERKILWINALHKIDRKKAKNLLDTILRENLRYKKGIRKLKLKKIPERVSEEVKGDT